MGVFTWTDARRKSPKINRYGDYSRKDVLEYGSFGKIVCPDGTEICEECYDGYGRFGSYDAYEVVVDWNKNDLKEIFVKKLKEKSFGSNLAGIAARLAEGISDEEITSDVKKLVSEGSMPEYLIRDWKRNIGIAIACGDKDNESLRYPLKITTTRARVRYEDLYPSKSTQ